MYCNDNWDYKKDGGALRIYLNSQNVPKPAMVLNRFEYTDINPTNGKLLIFDSRLVHSVEKVHAPDKSRLALTLWTLRPENRIVRGEIYDEGRPEVEYQN